MPEPDDPFSNVPPFEETIRRIARVPAPDAEELLIAHPVRDEQNDITYRIMSEQRLSPREVQKALTKAFKSKEIAETNSGEEVVFRI